jgi:hypothetical protein
MMACISVRNVSFVREGSIWRALNKQLADVTHDIDDVLWFFEDIGAIYVPNIASRAAASFGEIVKHPHEHHEDLDVLDDFHGTILRDHEAVQPN